MWLAALTLPIAALLWIFPDHVREYQQFLLHKRPDVHFAFDELSVQWTEAALKQRFPDLDWRCADNAPGEYLDARSCFAPIDSHNGAPAMNLAAHLRDGQVNQFTVHVPSWAHRRYATMLRKRLGRPLGGQAWPVNGYRLVGWEVQGGAAVFYNRDAPMNPLMWNQAFWMSAAECRRKPSGACFTPPAVPAPTRGTADARPS